MTDARPAAPASATDDDVLTRATPSDVRLDPFPHVTLAPCLDPALYDRLAGEMPVPRFGPRTQSNMLTLASPFEPPLDTALSRLWRSFVGNHVTARFFGTILDLLAAPIRAVHPELEAHLGRPLDQARVGWRGAETDADFRLDLQFGYNSPVRETSSVRGPHLDKTRRLVSALLYMPLPDDDAGGELILYRFRGDRRFQGVSARLEDVEPVATVPYEANRLILFVNGPDSLHGVSPRRPTATPRRYLNLFVDYREPLFSLEAEQSD